MVVVIEAALSCQPSLALWAVGLCWPVASFDSKHLVPHQSCVWVVGQTLALWCRPALLAEPPLVLRGEALLALGPRVCAAQMCEAGSGDHSSFGLPNDGALFLVWVQ
jgi:hypothetical protein